MLQYILWGICFFTLWITMIWIVYAYGSEKASRQTRWQPITIAIPAYNEEKTISCTVKSIIKADYPKDKLKIVIVNDGSTDNTKKAAESLIKKYKSFSIKLINKKNSGKADSVNAALRDARTRLFAVVDADSRISRSSIKRLVPHLDDPKTGAAISRIKIDDPKNLIEKVQRFEYIMSTLLRKIMSSLGTLSMTPGVLSVYKTEILKKLGGFSKERENLTEDLEIAMRLKYNNYDVVLDHRSITYTKAPETFMKLWKQRIRWSRGYIYNHIKYKDMFFSKKYGFFGIFQLPVNALAIILLMLNIGIISIMFLGDTYEFFIRSITIKGYFINWLTDFPTLKDLILTQNMHIMIPLAIAGIAGIYIVYAAHNQFRERILKYTFPVFIYFLLIPYFTTANWIASIIKEMFRSRRSW